MQTLDKYNKVNPLKDEKTVNMGRDVYTLEVRKNSYHVLINGTENKVYKRLPKDLRDFFKA